MKLQIRLAVAAALLSSASAATAGITYAGSVTPTPRFGIGNTLVADYTITTNGTIGNLSSADVTGWTLRFNYNGNIENLSGNALILDYGPDIGLSATATDLLFNFTPFPGFRGFAIGNTSGRFLDFNPRGNEIVTPPGTSHRPQITTFYINPSVGALFAGYNSKTGLEVIGTATAGAVPEPASWAMLIAGFGLTGAAMRRKARRITA